MALQKSLLQIDEASLFETVCSLKISNSEHTPTCLHFWKKSTPNFSLFFLYFICSFSYFQISLTVTFPCFCAILLYIFIIFVDSTKLKKCFKNIV